MGTIRSNLSTFKSRLNYLRKSHGRAGLFRRILAKIISPIIYVDQCYLFVRDLQSEVEPGAMPTTIDPNEFQVVVATSVGDLDVVQMDVSDYFDLEKCRAFLNAAANPIVVLSRKRMDDNRFRIVSVRTMERGVFANWEDRIRFDLPNEYVLIHENEVHPDYRGQRVNDRTNVGFNEYAHTAGIARMVYVIRTHNASSLRANKSNTSSGSLGVKGEIRRVRLFSGLVDRMPSPEIIREMILADKDA